MKDHFSSNHTIPAGSPERMASLRELKATLSQALAHQFAELWVDHGQFPALSALVSGDRGWLMLLRYAGDAGYSSRGTDDRARTGGELEFFLGNGQRDTYPVAWTLPTREVLDALEIFAVSRCVPESIYWHNDSADGSSGPNDPDFPRFDYRRGEAEPERRTVGIGASSIGGKMATAKQEVEAMLSTLPDDCSLEDIQYHLYVLEKIRNGIECAEQQGDNSQEETEQKLGKWST